MTPEEIVREVVAQSGGMSRPVYRGQANEDWPLESGAVRRLRHAYGQDLPENKNELQNLVSRYHMDQLIIPMQVIDGAELSNLQRLSILQHQGAATGFLDFTDSPLVALWFASFVPTEKDGKLFVLDIGDPHVAWNARSTKNPLGRDKPVMYYEPNLSLGARIIVQKSVFVIGNPDIPDRHIKQTVVPREAKKQLREYLKSLGLSEMALFTDIPGFSAANRAEIPLQRMDRLFPEQHRYRGNLAYQSGHYEDAVAAYERFATALPDVAQPYCLKVDTLAALGRFEDADSAYTKAMENLDRPVYPDPQTAGVQETMARLMSRTLYLNRGNVRAAAGNHNGAVADFDAALQQGYDPKRTVLYNRGNSKFELEMFEEAHADFEAAWSEEEGSDAALSMGNCKVKMGAFEDAIQRYMNGSAIEPEVAILLAEATRNRYSRFWKCWMGKNIK